MRVPGSDLEICLCTANVRLFTGWEMVYRHRVGVSDTVELLEPHHGARPNCALIRRDKGKISVVLLILDSAS